MPDHKREAKLSGRQQLRICSLIATGYNAQRICDVLKDEEDVVVSIQNVYQNYISARKWRKVILRFQREATRQLLKHPLASKINRLKIIQAALNEAFTWRLDKIHYNSKGKELSRIEKRNVGMVAQLIREARTEIEGEKPIAVDIHLTTIGNLHDSANKHKEQKEQEVGADSKPTNRLQFIE